MVEWSRIAVLGLYKTLLRRGYNLNYSSKDKYFRLIRAEFQTHKSLTELELKQKQLDKGLYFLSNHRAKIL